MQSIFERFEINNFSDFIRTWNTLSGSLRLLDNSPIGFYVNAGFGDQVSYTLFRDSFLGEIIPPHEVMRAVRKTFPIGKTANRTFFSEQALAEIEAWVQSEITIEQSRHPLRKSFLASLERYVSKHQERNFKEFITNYLQEKKLSANNFCELVHINRATFGGWVESKTAALPNEESLNALANTLQVEGNPLMELKRMCGHEIQEPPFEQILSDYLDEGGQLFSEFIRRVCKRWNVSTARLGEIMGVSGTAVSRWINGQDAPRHETVATIRENLQLSDTVRQQMVSLITGKIGTKTFSEYLVEFIEEGGNSFAHFLAHFLEHAHFSKIEFATKIGAHPEAVGNWLNGEVPKPISIQRMVDTFVLDKFHEELLRDLIAPEKSYTSIKTILSEYIASGGSSFTGFIDHLGNTWNVSRSETAKRLGIAKDSIKNWQEERMLPREAVIRRIAAAQYLTAEETTQLSAMVENDRHEKLGGAVDRIKQSPGQYLGRYT